MGISSLWLFGGTSGADADDNIIDARHLETFRQFDFLDGTFFQAITFLAFSAVEVTMLFLFLTNAGMAAIAIFDLTAAIFHPVNEVALAKQGQGSEDGGLVKIGQIVFDIIETEGIFPTQYVLIDKYSVGSSLDACLLNDSS